MMKGFGKRLFFYLIGFGLGCVLVWAMFYRNRERPAWTPEGRILEFLAKTEIQLNEKSKCQLECYDIDKDLLTSDFWKNGSVKFSESAAKRKPCPEYKIIGELKDGSSIAVYVETCMSEENATLRFVQQEGKECLCE